MEDTARMYEVAYQVRFWLDEILLIAALIVAVSSPRAPAKPWLVAMIAVSIAVGFGWYAWSLAQRAGSPLGDDTLRIVTMLAMNAVSLAVPASTVAFVVAWRSKSGSSVYGTTSSPDAGV